MSAITGNGSRKHRSSRDEKLGSRKRIRDYSSPRREFRQRTRLSPESYSRRLHRYASPSPALRSSRRSRSSSLRRNLPTGYQKKVSKQAKIRTYFDGKRHRGDVINQSKRSKNRHSPSLKHDERRSKRGAKSGERCNNKRLTSHRVPRRRIILSDSDSETSSGRRRSRSSSYTLCSSRGKHSSSSEDSSNFNRRGGSFSSGSSSRSDNNEVKEVDKSAKLSGNDLSTSGNNNNKNKNLDDFLKLLGESDKNSESGPPIDPKIAEIWTQICQKRFN